MSQLLSMSVLHSEDRNPDCVIRFLEELIGLPIDELRSRVASVLASVTEKLRTLEDAFLNAALTSRIRVHLPTSAKHFIDMLFSLHPYILQPVTHISHTSGKILAATDVIE